MDQFEKYRDIPAEKFEFAAKDDRLHDLKFETKPIGYFRDAFRRFRKNKSSVAAAIIILILICYAVFVPWLGQTSYSSNLEDVFYLQCSKLLPKNRLLSKLGIWDGCKTMEINQNQYNTYRALGEETGIPSLVKVLDEYEMEGNKYYKIKYDTYAAMGMYYISSMSFAEYEKIQDWQDETGIQVIFPAVDQKKTVDKSNASIWYEAYQNAAPKLDKDGNLVNIYSTTYNDEGYHSIRIEGDDGSYKYAIPTGSSAAPSLRVRVSKYNYFIYRYGFEPAFLFGTNDMGYDIFTRLASAARFSLFFAVGVSLINMFLGTIYGAIEGYYGGAADLIMERLSDILGGVPEMVVVSLFQLHLAAKVGPVVSLLFAFVATGWIGMASTVRMQFYRFKNQEYILASRTLGARDRRVMFKHILPNSLGTIITGCVLVIPGVIFGESSLTYLGIVQLDSITQTSVGTMLANSRDYLEKFPHIILFPALFISLLEISFNLFGNGLRDAFNPSLRGTED